MTFYTLEHPLSNLLGDRTPPLPQFVVLTMQGRSDLTQHFLVSAMTTLFSQDFVSDALGVAKELLDAEDERGSGFSFRDLAADRAGTRLMKTAARNNARLDTLIDELSALRKDKDLIPYVKDLPEGMNAEEFRRAWKNVQSEAYLGLVARIDARIDRCRVFQKVAAVSP